MTSFLLVRSSVLTIALLCACPGVQTTVVADDHTTIPTTLSDSMAHDKWKRVYDTLSGVRRELHAVERIVLGHACLAMNMDNEALESFLTASSPTNAREWDTWTAGFLQGHSNQPRAHYLRGDALARQGRWREAVTSFDRALSIRSDYGLALHARGVVRVIQEDWDAALVDLAVAARLSQDLSAPYTSVGMLWIARGEGAPGALAAFETALKMSPGSGLATYGKACVATVLGKWEEHKLCVKKIQGLKGKMAERLTSLVDEALDRLIDVAALADAKEGKEASMQLRTLVDDFKKGDWGFFGSKVTKAIGIVQKNPELRPDLEQGMKTGLTNNPHQINSVWGKLDRLHNSYDTKHMRTLGVTTSQSTTSGANVNVGGVGANIGDTVGTTRDLNVHSQMYRDLRDITKGIQTSIGGLSGRGTTPQGFKTNLDTAAWDSGQWPFGAFFVLAYPANTVSKKLRKGTTHEG